MNQAFVRAALLLVAAPALAQVPDTMDAASIPNYRKLSAVLATAGQPSGDALKKLKEHGFKTVVNLRTEEEPGVKEEKQLVDAQGLRYVSVPITPASFSQEQVDQVAKVLNDPEAGPVLLHCGSANRVGAVWTVIQAQRGKDYAEAEAEGKRIGLSSPAMVEAVKRVLEKPEK